MAGSWPEYFLVKVDAYLEKRMNIDLIPKMFYLKVFDFVNDPQEDRAHLSFMPDFYLKYKVAQFVRAVQVNNTRAWRGIIDGNGEEIRYDPRVQEHLRALGYVD